MILSGLNGGNQFSLSMNSACGDQNNQSSAFGYPSAFAASSYAPTAGLLSNLNTSTTSSTLQLQQQLQAYQQIPLSMQTPDIQSTVAQLQMRLRFMGISLYNNSTASNYPTSGLYQSSYSNNYSNSSTGTVNTIINSSLNGYSTGGR